MVCGGFLFTSKHCNCIRKEESSIFFDCKQQVISPAYKIKIEKDKMPSIAGKYQHYKNEDIDDYFIAVGVPFMGRKMMALSSPLMEITVDGDNMVIKNSSLLRTVEMKFKLGEEYEERMPSTTIKSITTLVNDNELVTQSVIPETGEKCGRHYMFTDDECVITLTHEKAKTPGKRYFRRVNS